MRPEVKKLLKELEKTREDFWNITPEVGEFIYNLILDREYRSVLEIGTSNGYSGLWLASALEKTGGTLYTVESNKKKRWPLAQENFQKSGLNNIVSILGHAPEAIPDNPKSFDLAFFDATKFEHTSYFEHIQNRINKGGIIISDNINSHREVMQKYIDHINSQKNWQSQEFSLGTGLLISQFTP